jgi:TRAP-type mannitol/chloroaromatic compound transport system substrate-binding protein
MDEKRAILTKLDELETDYLKEQKQLDDELDEILDEKESFRRGFEELGSDLNHLFRTHEYDNNIHEAYSMLEEAQEYGDSLLKKDQQKIEDDLEDLTSHYRKNVLFYEEDLDLLKRKESNT